MPGYCACVAFGTWNIWKLIFTQQLCPSHQHVSTFFFRFLLQIQLSVLRQGVIFFTWNTRKQFIEVVRIHSGFGYSQTWPELGITETHAAVFMDIVNFTGLFERGASWVETGGLHAGSRGWGSGADCPCPVCISRGEWGWEAAHLNLCCR